MSINWVLTNEDGSQPAPLPAEKIIFRSPPCQLHLEFKYVQEPVKWIAEGIATVTNQRIIFLRQPALPPPADPSQPSPHLRNLAIPLLGNLLSVKYAMPIFSAPHLELKVHPVRGGGLPQDAVAHRGVTRETVERLAGIAKITFRDGGGTLLKDAIDRALSNPVPLAGGRTVADPDPLPLYHAPPDQAAPASAAPLSEETASHSQDPPADCTAPGQAATLGQGDEPPPYAG
ncbi:hypothetical protein OC834_000472 [Tilletia horrida]|nr:hypothetical protein OC835_004647 [Tilletia horrida]KAK0538324.1 hypothetical protein OC834_000472 [Tilletia horrida]KAK0560500.1 hypothetical protein OC844_003726 [Tilletia horrida]